MRESLRRTTVIAVPTLLALALLTGCKSESTDDVNVSLEGARLNPKGASNWGGGAGLWSAGIGLRASGGSNWSGGGSNWSGGGGNWSGGGGNWSGGGGNWSGGGFWFAGGGAIGQWGGGGGNWSGGGSNWSGGGGNWSGAGSWWGGGGGNWSGGGGWWSGGGGNWSGGQWQAIGGGGNWSGGGGNWSGGGGNWSGGGGLWSGGFAAEFPLVGASGSRPWTLRGIPQPGYNPVDPPPMSGAQDTAACPAGQVRLGGFSYPIDVDNWHGVVALGYNQKLCVPTPAKSASVSTAGGLMVNSVASNTAIDLAGGYSMASDLGNVGKDALAMKTLVGFGTSNVATQFGGALCAAIGTHAAAKRSCGVGIAMVDPNTEKDGTSSQRGVPVKAAQGNVVSFNTPFGRDLGVGLFSNNENDMEGYTSAVLHKHKSITVPDASSKIDKWNDDNTAERLSFKGSDFAQLLLSDTTAAAATKLKGDVDRSVGLTAAPSAVNGLNMSPVDYGQALSSDMNKSLSMNKGELYALNLHSVAAQMSPLYGSGAGRWYFHNPSDPNAANLPLLDLSSVFQGSMQVLTGQLSGPASGTSTVNSPFLSAVKFRYADWRPEPSGGTLYIDKAGQWPAAVTSDADRRARLAAAFVVPKDPPNIAMGDEHVCALTSAGGGVKCWGANGGRLGDGTHGSAVSPVETSLTSGVIALTAGEWHTCALLSDATVKCWGYNEYGALGDGTTMGRPTPTAVPGLSNVTAVAPGWGHTCVVLSDATVKCWGYNSNGQLGDGTTTQRLTPTAVPGLSDVTALSRGDRHTCALLSDTTVKCWGINAQGQLGDGTTTQRLTPTAVPGLSNVTALAHANHHTCALLSDATVKCWGINGSGQLGDGTYTNRLTPTAVPGLSNVDMLQTGRIHTCALLSDATVKCWGNNSQGQLGDGTTTNRLTPTAVTNLSGVSSIYAGTYTNCARLTSGDIKCWGEALTPTGVGEANPTTFQGLASPPTGPTSLTAGGDHTCALRSNTSDLYCWGILIFGGQIGDGNGASSAGPVPISNLGSAITQLAAGAQSVCALLSDTTVKCWGDNQQGKLGDGTTTRRLSPTAVLGLSNVTALAAGWGHTCARLSDTTVKCWGYNIAGQLGDATTTYRLTPTAVPGLANVTALAPGATHTCALLSDATVKCWGNNSQGQVGDGTTAQRLTPTAVPGLSNVTALAAGDHTCALLSNTTVKCWGYNTVGQLGDGTYTNRLTPTAVPGLSNVTALSLGRYHTCALLSDATVKCWGYNNAGQVGDGTYTIRSTPTLVPGLSNVTALAAGDAHTCARLPSGDIKCWGAAAGAGTPASMSTPTSVGNIPDVFTNNFGIMQSQGSVLVEKVASTGQIGGHVTPVVQSMRRSSDGQQSLMLTYDPLAAAAALFIEQYDAHITACNNSLGTVTLQGDGTFTTTMTENDELSGQKIWACSTETAKANYISGMQEALAGARQYLFGRTDGCIQSTETLAGAVCASTLVDTTQWNPVYSLVVPDYSSSEFSNATTGYVKAIGDAATTYNSSLNTSAGSRYERTVQLVGTKKFTAERHALVTSQVIRPGSYGMNCVNGDGFAPQGVSSSTCGDGMCAGGETGASCPEDCYVCAPESDTDFCARRGNPCGSVTANDNCGSARTVTSCGPCYPNAADSGANASDSGVNAADSGANAADSGANAADSGVNGLDGGAKSGANGADTDSKGAGSAPDAADGCGCKTAGRSADPGYALFGLLGGLGVVLLSRRRRNAVSSRI